MTKSKKTLEPESKNDQQEVKSCYSSYSSGTTTLNQKEMEQVLHDLENPPKGTDGLKEILRTIESVYYS